MAQLSKRHENLTYHNICDINNNYYHFYYSHCTLKATVINDIFSKLYMATVKVKIKRALFSNYCHKISIVVK